MSDPTRNDEHAYMTARRASVLSAAIFMTATTTTSGSQLTAADGVANDRFGYSVALSGDTLVVGALAANDYAGVAYIYSAGADGWAQQAEVEATDAFFSSNFGYAVALSGSTALISAPVEGEGGAVFVFSLVEGQWVQQQKLVPNDAAGTSCFGCSVALSGNTALIGAQSKQIGSNIGQGAAYIFNFDGTQWVQMQELIPDDGMSGDMFGTVALSGNTALIGASGKGSGKNVAQGSAYVYSLVDGVWTQQQELRASDGRADDYFGSSVALWGGTAMVGSSLKKVGANAAQGAVYIFGLSGGTWTQQHKITAQDGAANDQFGVSISLAEDSVLIGAQNKVTNGSNLQGAAYVFNSVGNQWVEAQELFGNDSSGGTYFGFSLALQGSTALVGGVCANVGRNRCQGAAFTFDRIGDRIFHDGFDNASLR